jgi:hypothetical protein
MPNLASADRVPFMLSQAKLVSRIEEHEARLQPLVKSGLRFNRIGGLILSEVPR